MADTNNHLNTFNNDSLDLNQAIQDYTTDTCNNENDDLLTSTLIESKYYDMESLITYMKHGRHENNQIKVMHLNIQSLSAKYEQLKQLVSQLNDEKIYLDAILLCETFLHEGNANLFNMQGYNLEYRNRTCISRGGVAIYIRSNISYTVRDDLSTFIEGEYESLFIEANIHGKKIIMGEIYRTPASNANKSVEYYETTLEKLKKEKRVIIGTDQNFDLLKVDNHSQTASLFNIFLASSFIPCISKPTRITEHSQTLIDNIYTNNIQRGTVIKSGILLENISDHLPIFCAISTNTLRADKTKLKTIERRNITPQAINLIKQRIQQTNWEYLRNIDIEYAYQSFTDTLKKILDDIAPVTKTTVNDKILIRDPWMTKGLITSSNKSNSLYRKSVGKPKTHPTHMNYVAYRNKYNQLKRLAKQLYYAKLFEKYHNNAKMVWKTIKTILNRSTDKTIITKAFKVNGNTITDPKDISDEFCKFFTNIGTIYASNIPPSNNQSDSYLKKKRLPNTKSIYLTPTDHNEILKILQDLKPKKSAGHDNITPELLKQIDTHVAYPISILTNKSITSGIVPEFLKLSKVIPIFKSKSRDDLANYRPISLLPILSKILEKVIHKRLYTFLDSGKILNEKQFGFRKKHSTTDAVTKFINDIGKSLDNKESVLAVYCDLSRAFDTINHEILLRKLQYYGIRGHALKWFLSYLTKRKQYVNYNGQNSEVKSINIGVPQGSVLGPLLFIIYVNDLPDCLTNTGSILFADDTTIYGHNMNIDDLFNVMTFELQSLMDWFNANKLSLNLTKTYYMLFTNSKTVPKQRPDIQIGNNTVTHTSCMKFLGVFIDENLKWDKHIEKTSKRINSAFYAINQAKHSLNRKYLTQLYYSLVYPHLLYGIVLWGNTYNIYLNKLIVLQKKIIRAITGTMFNAHTQPLFKSLNILKLTDIYKLQVAKYVHSYVTNSLPFSLMDIFTPLNYCGNNTRQSEARKLRLPKTRTIIATRSIANMGPKIWNSIKSELYLNKDPKRIIATKCFTTRYKNSLLRSY